MILFILVVINLLIIEILDRKQYNLYKKHLKNKEINFDIFWKEHDNIDILLVILWWSSFVYIFLIFILLFI